MKEKDLCVNSISKGLNQENTARNVTRIRIPYLTPLRAGDKRERGIYIYWEMYWG